MKYVYRYEPINWKKIELRPYFISSAFHFLHPNVFFEELRKITRRGVGRFEEAKRAPAEACLKARVHRTVKKVHVKILLIWKQGRLGTWEAFLRHVSTEL